jgi:hypothetical protein
LLIPKGGPFLDGDPLTPLDEPVAFPASDNAGPELIET